MKEIKNLILSFLLLVVMVQIKRCFVNFFASISLHYCHFLLSFQCEKLRKMPSAGCNCHVSWEERSQNC